MDCESSTDIGVFARTMAVSHSHDYGVGDRATPYLILAGFTRPHVVRTDDTLKGECRSSADFAATRRHWRLLGQALEAEAAVH